MKQITADKKTPDNCSEIHCHDIVSSIILCALIDPLDQNFQLCRE